MHFDRGIQTVNSSQGASPMHFRACGLSFACLLVLSLALLAGCNNTLNPLCGSARPVPQIGSISPSSVSFSDIQQGVTLTVNGSQFVSSTQVVINTTPLAPTVVSAQELKLKLSSDVIAGPGQVKVAAQTPSGNSGDLGCTSGGTSSALILTVTN
jgi:hypothetical protein